MVTKQVEKNGTTCMYAYVYWYCLDKLSTYLSFDQNSNDLVNDKSGPPAPYEKTPVKVDTRNINWMSTASLFVFYEYCFRKSISKQSLQPVIK